MAERSRPQYYDSSNYDFEYYEESPRVRQDYDSYDRYGYYEEPSEQYYVPYKARYDRDYKNRVQNSYRNINAKAKLSK